MNAEHLGIMHAKVKDLTASDSTSLYPSVTSHTVWSAHHQ